MCMIYFFFLHVLSGAPYKITTNFYKQSSILDLFKAHYKSAQWCGGLNSCCLICVITWLYNTLLIRFYLIARLCKNILKSYFGINSWGHITNKSISSCVNWKGFTQYFQRRNWTLSIIHHHKIIHPMCVRNRRPRVQLAIRSFSLNTPLYTGAMAGLQRRWSHILFHSESSRSISLLSVSSVCFIHKNTSWF